MAATASPSRADALSREPIVAVSGNEELATIAVPRGAPGDDQEPVRRRQVEAWQSAMPGAANRLTWPLAQLWGFRDRRLRELLAHARERSAWHRDRLRAIDVDSVRGDDLSELPTMTKADLMANWDEIVCHPQLTLAMANEHLGAVAAGVGELYVMDGITVVATGGSTGNRAVIAIDFDGVVESRAAGDCQTMWLRQRGLLPAPESRPVQARLCAVNPVHLSGALARIFARGPIDLVTFPPTMAVEKIVEGLNRTQPQELMGYASMLHRMAVEAIAGRLRINPTCIRQGGEVLFPETRQLLTEAFGAPLTNFYGASESFIASSPPDTDWLHLFEDVAVFEFVDANNRPVAPGCRAAKILVTNVVNKVLPLIRYEITDEVTLLEGPNPGPWSGRRIADPGGRSDDCFDYDGLTVHPQIFRTLLVQSGVAEYQVRQTSRGADVDVVTLGRCDLTCISSGVEVALDRLGIADPAVVVRAVDAVPRHAQTGKLRRFVPLSAR
jgi:phenylacetate-coenzyme A ligase PaaK-like adenylate-forming protein